MKTLRQTINEKTKKHLQSGGKLFAQCTKAVGWIGGTVPSDVPEGIIELPTSDVSNGGIVVGHGLAGTRPIYVIRYQGFITYNGASIFNYAAKSKAMWEVSCPIFVRSIAMEGSIGPVASNAHHSVAVRFPGIKVFAPITPTEWELSWDSFMKDDDPVYCSEHRKTYDHTDNIMTGRIQLKDTDTLIIGIGYSRISGLEAALKLDADFSYIYQLKPIVFEPILDYALKNKKYKKIIVVDSDFTSCGVSEHVCCEISKRYGKLALPLGIDDRTAGFSPHCDNLTPSVEGITKFVRDYA